ncbi:NAD(P)-binding protein [Hesseltinella vesiculosa]|uniref:NAD(P)-binding protein n=1 Tax=Hesseltinella vesiculosa TaxID=101127 RepID=A0A1X2GXT3_9FUNG|nr:NAD(P)-binding protein [Hesseltinella vesiculosa]
MAITINSFNTTGESGKFKKVTRQVEGLERHQILIKILASGICHTDCYYMGQEGLCLGHEPAGVVEEVGSEVTNFKVGDRAGFSYLKSACLVCEQCVAGDDLYCQNRVIFPGNDNMNGYADKAVVDSRFAYQIPEGLDLKDTGVLMCAGSTVFNALYSTNTSPTHRVAIIGLGGLGHLALQFANKWGTHVTAISTTDSKKEEALSFGAYDFLNSKKFDDADYTASIEKFDLIINTASADLEYDQYIKLLKPKGKFLLVGVPMKPITVNGSPFIGNEIGMRGSLVGGRETVRKMLAFAAQHKIRPKIEELPLTLEGLEEGIDRCLQYKARYRVVLVAQE